MESLKNNSLIGILGEDIACDFLIKKGWKITHRNFREKFDEIDIIAICPDKTLVFCEVKALLIREYSIDGECGLMPEDNMTSAKLRKICRICEFFARRNKGMINDQQGWRIDLIAVDIGRDGRPSDIRHYENI